MRQRVGVVVLGVGVALTALPATAGANDDLPTPVAVPQELRTSVKTALATERRTLMDTRTLLAADIAKQKRDCGRVDTKDTALRKTCTDSLAAIKTKYDNYTSSLARFGQSVRLEHAMHRQSVALQGLESGMQAFQAEVRSAALMDLFEELNSAVPKLATLADPTKILPKLVLANETGKLLQWWNTFRLQKANGCSFPNENIRLTCQNVHALTATVERTNREFKEALIAFNPQLVPLLKD